MCWILFETRSPGSVRIGKQFVCPDGRVNRLAWVRATKPTAICGPSHCGMLMPFDITDCAVPSGATTMGNYHLRCSLVPEGGRHSITSRKSSSLLLEVAWIISLRWMDGGDGSLFLVSVAWDWIVIFLSWKGSGVGGDDEKAAMSALSLPPSYLLSDARSQKKNDDDELGFAPSITNPFRPYLFALGTISSSRENITTGMTKAFVLQNKNIFLTKKFWWWKSISVQRNWAGGKVVGCGHHFRPAVA